MAIEDEVKEEEVPPWRHSGLLQKVEPTWRRSGLLQEVKKDEEPPWHQQKTSPSRPSSSSSWNERSPVIEVKTMQHPYPPPPWKKRKIQ